MRPAEAIGRAIDRFYIGPVAAVVPRQTFRYAACGGLTYGLFDPACYFLVRLRLNRHVAFRQSPLRTRTQLFRYALSVGGSVVLTYAGLKFFVEFCGVWPTPAKILTTCMTTVYSYLAAKYFTFRHARE